MQSGLNPMKFDVTVVGAGPVGSYVSYLLSKRGYEVALIEEDVEVGKPVQCAGLVNSRLFQLEGLDQFKDKTILHDIYGADIYSPSGESLPIKSSKVKANVIDRSSFDWELFSLAVKNGVEPFIGYRVKSVSNYNRWPIVKADSISGNISLSSDLLIGCDGAGSTIRRIAKLPNPRENIPGINAELYVYEEGPQDIVGVFTGSKVAPGFFSWAIPSGPHSYRLGLSTSGRGRFMPKFRDFLRSSVLSDFLGIEKGSTLPYLSLSFGTLPMGLPNKIHRGKIILLGDSAGMAKPTSGGGIFPGMTAASYLAEEIERIGHPSSSAINSFIRVWEEGLGKELEKSLILRRMVTEVKDKEIDKVIGKLKDDKVINIINEKGDIDKPFQLAFELLMKKPSFMYMIPRFIPYMLKLREMNY